jgi:hypothetical protein
MGLSDALAMTTQHHAPIPVEGSCDGYIVGHFQSILPRKIPRDQIQAIFAMVQIWW